MKTYFLTFIMISNYVLGQNSPITGNYTSGTDYILISDSTLEFKANYGCCLRMDIYGFGKYKIRNDSVIVTTKTPPPGRGSTYRVLEGLSAPGQLLAKVELENETVPYVSVAVTDQNYMYNRGVTDSSGSVLLTGISFENVQNKFVRFQYIGADNYKIPLADIIGKSVLVKVSNSRTIENRLVAFEIVEDSGIIKLKGPFFPLTKKQRRQENREYRRGMGFNWYKFWRPWRWFRKETDTHSASPVFFVKQ